MRKIFRVMSYLTKCYICRLYSYLIGGNSRSHRLEHIVVQGCIRVQDIFEPYMPDRIVRQFGRCQRIPLRVIKPKAYPQPNRLETGDHYHIEFDDVWCKWEERDRNRLYPDQFAPAIPPSVVTDDYYSWYLPRTHPRMRPPVAGEPSRETGLPRLDQPRHPQPMSSIDAAVCS